MKFIHNMYLLLILAVVGVCLFAPSVRAEDPPVFVSQWGSYGFGPGYLGIDITGIALDNQANVFVVQENTAEPVQKFTSFGTFLTEWGCFGCGPYEFYAPQGVTVDSQGNFYVADTGNSLIKKFSNTGVFLGSWTAFAFSLAVDSQDYIYATAEGPGFAGVKKFTNTGGFILEWGGSWGSGLGQFFGRPMGIAIDSEDNVYVTDGGNYRIQKFTNTGGYITSWGSGGSDPGQFVQPGELAVDHENNVYVADTKNDRIQKFTSDGTFLSTWGTYGMGPNEFMEPRGIAIDSDGYIYVADRQSRIQKFAYITTSVSETPSLALSLVTATPNPFNEHTTLRFNLPQTSDAVLEVYDVAGHKVTEWRWSQLAPGSHEVPWNGRGIGGKDSPSGVLFGRLTVNGQTSTAKFVHLK